MSVETTSAVEFNDANFETAVLGSDVPVVVDFWAPWCPPCKALSPVVDELAERYAGRVKVGKVNVDENTGLATTYEVAHIPTLLFVKNGEIVQRTVGLQSKSELGRIVDGLLT